MLSFLLALALVTQAPCTCPDSSGAKAGAEALAVTSGADEAPDLVACGYRDQREAAEVIATEIEVFACSTEAPILSFDATQTARIQAETDRLLITQIESWPFAPDGAWGWVPIWSYTVISKKSGPVVSKVMILKPPVLTAAQIAEALEPLEHASKIPFGRYYEVIGRVFEAALTGNPRARAAFEHLPELLFLHSYSAEIYSQALQTYKAYYRSP